MHLWQTFQLLSEVVKEQTENTLVVGTDPLPLWAPAPGHLVGSGLKE